MSLIQIFILLTRDLIIMGHSQGNKTTSQYDRHFNIDNRTEDDLYMFIKVHFT